MASIRIGNKDFTVHKSKYVTRENIDTLARYSGRTIYECYTKPSTAKLSIYKEWLQWAVDNEVTYFGVSSYNGWNFSLQGLVEFEGILYTLSITSSGNKAYIVG